MESQADNRRSQKRIEASLPVQIRGADPQGEPFEEFTAAVDVSRRGLSLLTARELQMFSTDAVVVAVRRENDMNRVGLRFVGATLPIYTSETR